jgi:hypothetical protein
MSEPISPSIRRLILKGREAGEPVSSLARRLHVSRGSIYKLTQRQEAMGNACLSADYSQSGAGRPDHNDFVYRSVRCMRTWHPYWGAEKIHAEMRLIRPGLKLPHYRTFFRWFHWNGQLESRIKSCPPSSLSIQATHLHEGWQIDAKEELVLANGSKNCWLNIVDEYSGTVIDPPVFPPQED